MSEQTPAPETQPTPVVVETKPAAPVKAAPKKAAAPKKPVAKKTTAVKKQTATKPKAAPKKAVAKPAAAKSADSIEQAAEKGLDMLKLSRTGSQEILTRLVEANTGYWTRRVEAAKTLAEADSPEAFIEAEQAYIQSQIEEMTKAGREVFELANKTTTAVLEDLQRFTR